MSKILIIDDDPAVRASLELLLKHAAHQPLLAPDRVTALEIMRGNSPELVLLDMNFSRETSGEEGLKLLGELHQFRSGMPIILITAWGSIDLAVQGMKAGAVDFINKPWRNDHLLRSIKTALKLSQEGQELHTRSRSRKELDRKYDFKKLIGEDRQLLTVLETVGRVSGIDASVLILGESGTGKELIAEAIHQNSPRCNQPFVKVNLGGISTTLFESEMFGHKKGAFTDARYDRVGRFQKANRGSIFLDEIGDLDRTSQVKLLRVLQDRSFEVLGSSQAQQVDVRLICATNRDLNRMVAEGDFREDLFYRINLISIKLPALQEHPGDIPILVRHFINNLKKIYGRSELQVDPKVLDWLKNLTWSGNIRELKNLVERTVLVTGKDFLKRTDFADQLEISPKSKSGLTLPQVGEMTLEEVEISMIKKALEFHAKNIKQVAQSLGLSRAALYRRLEKYGLNI
ncbi:MAG: sigma-54-dependent Fis family transcriptional regulator [Candidatus Marinimicrobia bacterium]|nr:sigma-54-dependent Fis family transcriptional regulator [Candidatus Neomarinimicrobiota bacterium]